VEKEQSRNRRDSKVFGNSKKEENHEPSEDNAVIDQSLEAIYSAL
jgi:hypothetical protein